MKLKTVLSILLVALLSISCIMTARAATISNDGEYSLVLYSPNDAESGCFDGEYAELIRFKVSEGEKIVKISELTKGITPFNSKNEFSHWEVYGENAKAGEELAIENFKASGNFYTSTGKEIVYNNGLILVAKFDGKPLNDSGNYYVSFDAFGGTVNGKAKLLSVSKSAEFTTIDLTKYVPVRKDCTFKGWDLDGKIVTAVDVGAFAKDSVVNLTATYIKDTFDGKDRVLKLNANGGTVDGKAIGEYDYLGGGDSGTSMSLLPYTPVREGYTFAGWNTKSDGSGKNYNYIYWRLWDNNGKTDVEKDTLLKNELGAEYYQNVTLYASWTKVSEETVKEIESTGETKAKIEFAKDVSKNYKLDIKPIEVKKELADKNVKFIADINVLDGSNVIRISDTEMKIRIALPEDLKGYDKYEVVYILNDEIRETIAATVEDGYIVFKTSHLSQYGIIATNVGGGTEIPPTSDNSNLALWFAVLFISSTAAIGTTVINRKKHNN